MVFAVLEAVEGSAECQVADNIKGEKFEPGHHVDRLVVIGSLMHSRDETVNVGHENWFLALDRPFRECGIESGSLA